MHLTTLRISDITPLLVLLITSGVAMVTACRHAPAPVVIAAPKPQILTVSVDAGSGLNPDPNGHASSVVVRIYQLSSDTEFMHANFGEIYRSEAQTLGKTLVAKQEFVAFPDEHRQLAVEVAHDTSLLGVVIAFRDIDHATWRLTGEPRAGSLRLTLGTTDAQLAAGH
jgi:type VI secretion system protein VasD